MESLLDFDQASGHSLAECVSDAAEDALQSNSSPDFMSWGPYRRIRLLGTGGMGSVYLAERTDGEIQQKVAVKLLRADIERPAWRDRFLKERQLLAYLNHSSITRLIDAGHTSSGRPYLVMEYVDGISIDIYAERMDLRAQLALFLPVCDGVAYAHSRLIIHRDLKPSNILVDASGQPKLLDFGTAKLLDQTQEPTQTLDRLLTPNYASPEQLRGETETTASDVYSLGAVLYRILTGRSPHESDSGTVRTIDVITGTRNVMPPSRLKPGLPRDIDYILLKALRSEPNERYSSVEALANDIRAFLEWRPVEARSGDGWYRTRRFLRRRWVPVGAAGVTIMALALGLYIANRERVVAERRFRQLSVLSNKVFDLDRIIRDLPASTQARQSLVASSLEYLEGLASDVRGDLDLAREVGGGYLRLARIQGVPIELNLGERSKAEASLKKADELMETVLASRPNDRTALLRSASIAHDRMILAEEEHHNADALAYARKASERSDTFLRSGNPQASDYETIASMLSNIALAHVNMHLYQEAIPYARRAVELMRPVRTAQDVVSAGLSLLANALRYQGDLEGALRAIQEARQVAQEAQYPNETMRMANMYGVLLREGFILGEDGGVNLDRRAEAISAFQQALDLTEEWARKDPRDALTRSHVGTSGRELGNVLRYTDPQRALEAYGLALQRLREIPESVRARRDQALVLANSSYALRSLHRFGEAKQRINDSFAILRDTKDYPADQVSLDSPAYVALSALADYQAEAADLRPAIETFGQLLEKVMASRPETLMDLRDTSRRSRLYEALATLYRRVGDSPKAQDMHAKRLELWQHWDRTLPDNAFIQRQLAAATHGASALENR